jgi:hypothetical protein
MVANRMKRRTTPITTKIEMSLPLIAERKIEFKIILSVEY